jgi:hypothetical protein
LSTRLPRDHYVRLASNDYSVHPAAIGRRIEVTADGQQVRVCCEGRSVAVHERCWATRQTITDPAHRTAADQLRTAARRTGAPPASTEVEYRRLGDYDRLFGLDELEVA